MDCVLYGVGSPFVETVREALRRAEWTVRGGVENVETEYRSDLEPIVGPGDIPSDWLALPVVLPLITPGHRWSLAREALELGFTSFARVIDPSAVVSSTAAIGEGSFVLARAVIGADVAVGSHACVNLGGIVSHHGVLADYATLGPGAVLCGHVTLERGAFVGAGAVVNPKVTIGANAFVGSGSVVRRDVPPHTLVAGNPAAVVADNIAGYNEVSVGDPLERS